MKNITQCIMLTGAAARLSQEVAIIDKLIEKKGLKISESDTLLAGFSSGALNITAINACFRNDNPKDWDRYYKENILFNLKNDQVFRDNSFPYLPIKDTTPLEHTIGHFLHNTEMQSVKDLKFYSFILTMLYNKDHVSPYERNQTLWANSRNIAQQDIKLSSLLMSSTAIPVVFPSQEIHPIKGGDTNFPTRKYYDGGTKGTFNEFENYLGALVNQRQKPLEKLYIISPMREENCNDIELGLGNIWHELEEKLKDELKDFISTLSMKSFLRFLEALSEWNKKETPIAKEVFVCIPKMDQNYEILDFSKEEAQYNSVCQWVDNNESQLAVPLEKYLQRHLQLMI